MIHVNEQPEPLNFDVMVRQKGLSFLQKKSIDLHAILYPFPYIVAEMDATKHAFSSRP